MGFQSGIKEEKSLKMLWNNFKVAFAMYSKIPMPMADWNKENMKYTFCFFPFIGLVIGALSYLVGWAGGKFGFNPSFVSAVLVLVPVMVTGGIHVDGLLDTSDALSSWQERERRLEILKDSHAGAFAVITACAFFLIWYGAYSQLWTDRRALLIMALGFMVSRCLSGISVMMFPKARKDGTVAEFSRKAEDMIDHVYWIAAIYDQSGILQYPSRMRRDCSAYEGGSYCSTCESCIQLSSYLW